MPIFDYKCEKCFHKEEKLFKTHAAVLKEYRCSKCDGFMLQQIPRSSFELRGNGWYKDGYSTKSPPPHPWRVINGTKNNF